MPVNKAAAPGHSGDNETTTAANRGTPSETGQGNTPFPADAREDQVDPSNSYHDSLSGRAVTAEGRFLSGPPGEVPPHRIVSDEANTK